MSGVYGSHKHSTGRSSYKGGESTRDGGSGGSRGSAMSGTESGHGPAWQIDFNEVELGELIATGSFGIVHSGRYQGKKVAIKFLLFPESSSEDELTKAKRGFRQEVSVWHNLQHPNIVQFIGAYVNPPKWAIVTEFLDAGTVKSFLTRLGRRKLPVKQIVGLALDIAKGMQYLHANNIIHRDLKSANLLLSSSGQVKVADFGLARMEAQDPGNMTAETGTIRWMAPEMIDHQPYTRKVDVYSFGIVLWELCSNQWPFEGYSFVQLAHAIISENVRPPIKEVPPALVPLVTSCWDKDPDKRPDFDQVVASLAEISAMASTAPGKKGKSEDGIIPVGIEGGATSVEGATNGKTVAPGGNSSHDGIASRHGPREEPVQDSGWKKISVDPGLKSGGDEEPTKCGCSII